MDLKGVDKLLILRKMYQLYVLQLHDVNTI